MSSTYEDEYLEAPLFFDITICFMHGFMFLSFAFTYRDLRADELGRQGGLNEYDYGKNIQIEREKLMKAIGNNDYELPIPDITKRRQHSKASIKSKDSWRSKGSVTYNANDENIYDFVDHQASMNESPTKTDDTIDESTYDELGRKSNEDLYETISKL